MRSCRRPPRRPDVRARAMNVKKPEMPAVLYDRGRVRQGGCPGRTARSTQGFRQSGSPRSLRASAAGFQGVGAALIGRAGRSAPMVRCPGLDYIQSRCCRDRRRLPALDRRRRCSPRSVMLFSRRRWRSYLHGADNAVAAPGFHLPDRVRRRTQRSRLAGLGRRHGPARGHSFGGHAQQHGLQSRA